MPFPYFDAPVSALYAKTHPGCHKSGTKPHLTRRERKLAGDKGQSPLYTQALVLCARGAVDVSGY